MTLSQATVYANCDGIASSQPDRVLNQVRLAIGEGEWLTIVGKNGSGKSTLAKILSCRYPVHEGEVRCALNSLSAIQLIMQNPEAQLVGETIYEDVCFGLEQSGLSMEEVDGRARHALAIVGLADRASDPTDWLSGGQKQLLALAGALAQDADVFIFDEATSMLDPSAREMILHQARSLRQAGKTVVWITQLMDELGETDRVVVLEQGGISFEADKETFFYSDYRSGMSPCAYYGFEPPYAVQVAHRLRELDVDLPGCPITPEQLALAVGELRCR